MSINLNSKVSSPAGVHLSKLNDSAVALNLNNENYYGLNPTALTMYQALVNSSNIAEALGLLAKDFAISEEDLKADLLELLTDLDANGLVTISELE